MRKALLAVLLGLGCVATTTAHFVFVVPDADGKGVKVVFSDDLSPDENVDIAKIAKTTMTARNASGKSEPVKLIKAEHAYTAKLAGVAVVEGVTDYGVLDKGKGKPYLLRYLSRAILDPNATVSSKEKPAVLEVVPAIKSGEVRFQVLASGKPVAGAEVNVILPGSEKKKVVTGKDGWTEAFKQKGRFGMWTRHVETRDGTEGGKKYGEARTYATLVVDVK